MRKGFTGVVITLLLTILCFSTVWGDELNEYRVSEIGIKFSVPDSNLGYTRTSGIDDNVMKALGYTTDEYKDRLMEKMERDDLYYVGYDANVTYEVSLRSKETHIATLDIKTDEAIIQLIDEEGLDGEFTQMGMEINEKSVFTENERKYAVVGVKDTVADCYVYATVNNHQIYYFYVKVYNGGVTEAHKALIKQIAGSAEFIEKKKVEANGDSDIEDNGSDDDQEHADKIKMIVKLAAVLIGFIIAIIIIIGFSTKKKGGGEIKYSTRKDPTYRDRLSRVMQDEYDEIRRREEEEKAREARLQVLQAAAEREEAFEEEEEDIEIQLFDDSEV